MAGLLDFIIDIPCVKQMRVDPMPTASLIEAVVGAYLLPPAEGIYFRGKTEPVMTPLEVYHQHKVVDGKRTKETFVVKTIEDIDHHMPVMDLDANVVVTPNQVPFLSYIPPLPVTALKIVEAAVKDVVDSHGMEEYRSKPRHPAWLYGRMINLPVRGEVGMVAPIDTTVRDAVIDQITELVSGIRSDVKSFCGENPWVIHFLKKNHLELVIEKSIDWRIIEFHTRTGTKLEHYE
jgi:hypothetical protein